MTRPPADLLEQHVAYPLDEVVPVSLRPGRAVPPLLHGGEEGVVEDKQLVQTGEDPLHRLRVQLHLLPHTSPENLGHDVERLQVVELRLHQLCVTKSINLSCFSTGAVCGSYARGDAGGVVFFFFSFPTLTSAYRRLHPAS